MSRLIAKIRRAILDFANRPHFYLATSNPECLLTMLLSSLALLGLAATSLGASLVQVKDFGANPTKIQMYIYVPDKLATKPAVVVAVSHSKA